MTLAKGSKSHGNQMCCTILTNKKGLICLKGLGMSKWVQMIFVFFIKKKTLEPLKINVTSFWKLWMSFTYVNKSGKTVQSSEGAERERNFLVVLAPHWCSSRPTIEATTTFDCEQDEPLEKVVPGQHQTRQCNHFPQWCCHFFANDTRMNKVHFCRRFQVTIDPPLHTLDASTWYTIQGLIENLGYLIFYFIFFVHILDDLP